jgi:hypothetical protein
VTNPLHPTSTLLMKLAELVATARNAAASTDILRVAHDPEVEGWFRAMQMRHLAPDIHKI